MTEPIRADEITPEDVDFIWGTRDDPDLIPRGMFSMIAGKPDQGKSMMATRIAADVTRRGGNVLYSSKERKASLVEWPRFVAAGGVQSRMHYWRFTLPRQFDELARHLVEDQIDLLVMDPVAAHFSISTASDRVREEAINQFTVLIETTNTAVIFIEHALKRVPRNADPLSAIRGNSSGIPATCAMAYLFGTDLEDEETKVLANVKCNIREKPQAARFEIDDVDVEGVVRPQPALIHTATLEAFDAVTLISRGSSEPLGRPNDKRAVAIQWLGSVLADGPVAAKELKESVKEYGFSDRTLRRARQDMGVVVDPPGGGPNVTWALPEMTDEAFDRFLEGLNGA